MKSIERRFEEISHLNPDWSSYVCFTEAVKGQKFTKRAITKWFNRLIKKEDYSKGDRSVLMDNLMEATNEKNTLVER
jgi:hypothetical protein